jgi:hypothetical protein
MVLQPLQVVVLRLLQAAALPPPRRAAQPLLHPPVLAQPVVLARREPVPLVVEVLVMAVQRLLGLLLL